MSESTRAVFLSYASQDEDAAARICAGLRAAGIEVWFDRSELRGGDAWDQKIRREIRDCALFVPIISRNTQARAEGYFRLEWHLADRRTQLRAKGRAFLVPICVDDTHDADAEVPDSFSAVQWTRLPGGDTPPAFAERIARLLSPDDAAPMSTQPPGHSTHADVGIPKAAGDSSRDVATKRRASSPIRAGAIIFAAALVGVLAYYVVDRSLLFRRAPLAPVAPATPVTMPAASQPAFSPPAHSVAVLPFLNMSGDPKQDYFSDGLSEELLNSLASIRDLHVAARTSSFSFRGKNTNIADIAHQLNVGAILEGSVRRDGTRLRITAQLINAITGYHLWSQTYDRNLHNVLALQAEIATAVTTALQATLLGGSTAAIEMGGTQNPQAFDAYLRGQGLPMVSKETMLAKIAAFDEAIRLDPHFAKAYAAKSEALGHYSGSYEPAATARKGQEQARELAEKAVALAPDLAEAHVVLAAQLDAGLLDFSKGLAEYERALALAPGDARVLRESALFLVRIGRTDTALANAERAVGLDPVNAQSHADLATVLLFAHHQREAIAAFNRTLSLDPNAIWATGLRGWAYLWLGEPEAARQSCDKPPASFISDTCIAIAFDKLHRTADARARVDAMQKSSGDSMAYQYAEVYAQWGDRQKALGWLATAYRLRDPGLAWLRIDSFLDPLRTEPQFQEIERKLNFPT